MVVFSVPEGGNVDDGVAAKENAYRKTPHPSKGDPQRLRLDSEDSSANNLFTTNPVNNNNNNSTTQANDDDDDDDKKEGKRDRSSDADESQGPAAKKFASSKGTEDDADPPVDDAMNGEKESEMTGNDASNDNEEQDDVAAEEEWKHVCEELLKEDSSSPYRQRLQVFLHALQRREAGQLRLEKAYVATQTHLDENLEKLLQVAIPVHSRIYEKMLKTEQDLIDHLGGNHEKRQAILEALQTYNSNWERKYNGFLSRITTPGAQIFEATDASNDDGPKQDDTTTSTKDGDQKNDDGDEEDSGISEPDWDELLDFDPDSRGRIESFLESRDRWQAVCQNFGNTLDEIHAQLKSNQAAILQSVEEAYNQICDDLDKQQYDIQEHVASNFQRRQFLEKALDEVLKKQQSIFERLRARVVGAQHQQQPSPGGFFQNNPFAQLFCGRKSDSSNDSTTV